MESQDYKKWIGGVFDRSAKTYGQKHNTYFDYFAQRLVTEAKLPAGAHVLDIATGRGVIAQEAAKFVGPHGRVVGIDISPNMIQETEVALKNYANIELKCMDAEHLDLLNDTFDYVFCGFGIFFFPNVTQALSEFLRVLKPGGKLLISTWDKQDQTIAPAFFDAYKTFNTANVNLVAHNFENPDILHKTLSQAGFASIIIKHDQIDWVYPTIHDWFNSMWTHGMRGLLEKLDQQQLEALEAATAETLKPFLKDDGLHQLLRVHYAITQKSL